VNDGVKNGVLADLFVYGTLVPGGHYWDQVAAAVQQHRRAHVRGRLYDTGRGYPAAVFDDDGPEIAGVVLTLADPPGALARLDEFEGEEYIRREVVTTDGDVVWSYEWQAGIGTFSLVASGVWL
jgi:gamma-glutamylcyclotransferase (GGCT)/AIG2-like uncharacterized protein YtfP